MLTGSSPATQRLHQVPPPQVRRRKPPDRVHCLPPAGQAPRHHRPVHQRPREGGVRAQHGALRDPQEGRAPPGRQRREAQEGDEAGAEYQRVRQRRLVPVPRHRHAGVEKGVRRGLCRLCMMVRDFLYCTISHEIVTHHCLRACSGWSHGVYTCSWKGSGKASNVGSLEGFVFLFSSLYPRISGPISVLF